VRRERRAASHSPCSRSALRSTWHDAASCTHTAEHRGTGRSTQYRCRYQEQVQVQVGVQVQVQLVERSLLQHRGLWLQCQCLEVVIQ